MSRADISGSPDQPINTKNLLSEKSVFIKDESALSYLWMSVTIRGIHKWDVLKCTSYSNIFLYNSICNTCTSWSWALELHESLNNRQDGGIMVPAGGAVECVWVGGIQCWKWLVTCPFSLVAVCSVAVCSLQEGQTAPKLLHPQRKHLQPSAPDAVHSHTVTPIMHSSTSADFTIAAFFQNNIALM